MMELLEVRLNRDEKQTLTRIVGLINDFVWNSSMLVVSESL